MRGLTQRPGHRGQGSDLRGSLSSQSIDHLHVVVSVSIPFPVEEARSLSHLSVDSLKNKTLVPYYAQLDVLSFDDLACVFPMDTQWTLNGHSMDTPMDTRNYQSFVIY